jgi:UDP-N-acetyl-D-glucosamine dehydrogenase
MTHLDTFRNRIASRDAVVCIYGLGYVGLPLALRFTEVGFRVIGVDIDEERVAVLNSGRSGIDHLPNERVAKAREAGFEATTDFARTADGDALIVCVPTPLNRYREPDLSYVTDTGSSIAPYLRAGQLMALESTTYPGTTEEVLQPLLARSGLVAGTDYFLVYSPEREDPGNAKYPTHKIPKICGGLTPDCLAAGMALYGAAIETVVPVSTPRAAEMTKLLENIHRVVNIGLVNEMKVIAARMGIDIHEVIDAAATKPFGFTPYYPGPGIGGHCIPIDPFYLTWKAREFGVHTRFIELAGEINTNMPRWVRDRVADALNGAGKALSRSKVLILGVAYKKNIDDLRESPALELIHLLRQDGAELAYADPFVPRVRGLAGGELRSVAIDATSVAEYDLVLLVTNHDAFDYDLIRAHAQLIVDTRGVYRDAADHIVKA